VAGGRHWAPMDRDQPSPWTSHLSARLGLAPLPPGHRPPPGAGVLRLMFALLWLVLAAVQAAIWLRSRGWISLALAVLWFALAVINMIRARRLFEAERRPDGPD
jgi:hypothetical protein